MFDEVLPRQISRVPVSVPLHLTDEHVAHSLVRLLRTGPGRTGAGPGPGAQERLPADVVIRLRGGVQLVGGAIAGLTEAGQSHHAQR